MADIQFFDSFIDELMKGGHNLQADTFKIALTNTAPNLASQLVWNTTNAPPPAAANNYPAGGGTVVVVSASTVDGVFTLVLEDFTFTAEGGAIGPFQYAWLCNSSKGNKAVGVWAAPTPITVPDGGSETIDFEPEGVLIFGVGTVD